MTQTILVVEDFHDLRVEIRNLLEGEGFTVHTAAHGREALDLLEKIDPPSLIIIDWIMPIMGGEEFLNIIKQMPRFTSIPVMVYSGTAQKEIPGTCCVVTKSRDTKEFLTRVKGCLS